MKKTAYLFGVVFLSLVVIADIFHYTFYKKLGPEVVTMPSFLSWIMLSSIVYLAAFAFLLRYFLLKGWKLVFGFGSIAWLLAFVLAVMQYTRIVEVQAQPYPDQNIILVGYHVFITITGIALFIACRKNDTALKISAVLISLTGLTYLMLLFAALTGSPLTFENKISPLLQISSTIVWLLFIGIFISAIRNPSGSMQNSGATEYSGATQYSGSTQYSGGSQYSGSSQYTGIQKNILLIAGIMSLVLIASFFGAAAEVNREIGWAIHWKQRGPVLNRERAAQFEDRYFVGPSGDSLHYYLKRPMAYDSTRAYPLVTCLHGGAVATSNDPDIAEPAPLLINSENSKKFPAFVFVPQVSIGHTWGGLAGYPGMDNLVFSAIESLQREFNLDSKRFYISGISGGGYGSWDYISKRPDLFAAAMPICGRGDPAMASRIAQIPVWAFHGDIDRNVSVKGSRDVIAAMRAAGGAPKYSEFKDIGHNVWPEVERTSGVLDWLFAQKKTD